MSHHFYAELEEREEEREEEWTVSLQPAEHRFQEAL